MVIFMTYESLLMAHSDVQIEKYENTGALLEYQSEKNPDDWFDEWGLVNPIFDTSSSRFDRLHDPFTGTSDFCGDLLELSPSYANYFLVFLDRTTS